jgi:hypothetical protein
VNQDQVQRQERKKLSGRFSEILFVGTGIDPSLKKIQKKESSF